MPDLEVTGRRSETTDKGVTTYTLTLKICNKDDKPVKVKVASNAWMGENAQGNPTNETKEYPHLKKPDGTLDPGATRKEALKKWKNPETGDDAPLELAKKDDPKACKEYKLVWTKKPAWTYIDIFVIKPDGTVEDKFSATFNKRWADLQLGAYYPKGPKPSFTCAFPIPYPMALEAVTTKPIKVVIEDVEGLPRAVELLSVFPAVGEPFPLGFGDRGSVGVLVMRQGRAVEGRHSVDVRYRVVDPRGYEDWSRTMSFDLVPAEAGPARGRAGR